MTTGYSTPADSPRAIRDLLDILRGRHSTRAAFEPARTVPAPAVADLLEAARWAPTAHNMQNFEIVVVDDPAVLAQLGAIESPASELFVRENYRQLSFSRDELRRKQVGVLAETFPAEWRDPAVTPEVLHAMAPSHLRDTIRGAPLLLVITHDPAVRAPASDHDVLGMMSLGCVMENLWLAAHASGLGFHVVSAFAGDLVAYHVKRVLGIPAQLNVAFAVAIGYPTAMPENLRVRRDIDRFVHRNHYRDLAERSDDVGPMTYPVSIA